jgi:hypothetical protein
MGRWRAIKGRCGYGYGYGFVLNEKRIRQEGRKEVEVCNTNEGRRRRRGSSLLQLEKTGLFFIIFVYNTFGYGWAKVTTKCEHGQGVERREDK